MKKYYHFDLDTRLANILSVVILFGLGVLYFLINKNAKIDIGPLFLMILIGYFWLHELFHGLGFMLFVKNKKHIKFGMKLEKGVFYTLCEERINKKGIIISLLFPTIFLSIVTFIISIIFNNTNLALLSIANFGGAIGDILMVILILKCPKDVEYIDYDNNIGCYLISKHDLSKIKSLGFKYIGSGLDSDKLIKNNKRIDISKTSKIWIIVYINITIILIIERIIK